MLNYDPKMYRPAPHNLGGGMTYRTTAVAARARHCRVRVVVDRVELRPGVFRDLVEDNHAPHDGAYDAVECKRVKCPNRASCAKMAYDATIAQAAGLAASEPEAVAAS